MAHSFNVYIDESGDDGLRKFRVPGGNGGASHWLVIGACIVRSSRDLELVGVRDQVKKECKPNSKGRSIHFVDFSHNQKRRAAQIIAQAPIRITSVICLKNTENAGVFREKNQLYFYVTRFLIERISWLCRDFRSIVKEGDGRAKITFSRRGGLSYQAFRDYLTRLRDTSDTTVHWPVIDIDAIEAKDHSTNAGLQLADCCTSSIAASIEKDPYGNVEGSYLEELASRIYSRNGKYLSYGLKFLPNLDEIELDKGQAQIFGRFG